MSYFDDAISTVKTAIEQKSEEELVGVDTDELVSYYFALFGLPLIERDTSRNILWEKGKTPFAGWGRKALIIIRYPVVGVEKLKETASRTASTSALGRAPPRLEGDELVVMLEVTEQTDRHAIEEQILSIEQEIQWKNNDVKKGNERFKTEVRENVNARKNRIQQDTALIEKLVEKVEVPLKRRTSSDALTATLNVKKEIKAIMPSQHRLEEYVLKEDSVKQLVEILRSAGLWFERTPRVFASLEEEELRDILLGGLNMIFEGEATGETFSKVGKTDIRLRISKGEILIAECKIWRGKAYYTEGIDQLFRYLTWREDYGLLITFVREKGFSDVIATALNTATAHLTCIGDPLVYSQDSYFVTNHRFPDDPKKVVKIHHLLFNLFAVSE